MPCNMETCEPEEILKTCPVCGSTRFKQMGQEMICDRCGYEHHERPRGKVLISKTGHADENHYLK